MNNKSNVFQLTQAAEKSHKFGSLKRLGISVKQTQPEQLKAVFKEKLAAKPFEHGRLHCTYGL